MTTRARESEPRPAAANAARDRLHGRLGLSVPHEWWPSAPLLKSYEAAGFSWVQLHAPPLSVLTDTRQATRHAAGAAAALRTTGLFAVIHAPNGLRAGTSDGDRIFAALLSYTAEVGATQVVYHALALPESHANEAALGSEARSLAVLARLAERLELTIGLENLAPLYPGPETLSASPLTLRSLARKIDSRAIALCLDVGHAHVTADLRHTWVDSLCEPVLDTVSVFHLHDNLGARSRPSGDELGVDPLRLDLHLPPGRGTIAWERVGPLLAAHRAPLICEAHPPYRPRTAEVAHDLTRLLARRPRR